MIPKAAMISNAVVALMVDRTGRGPTKARTTMAPDVIVVVLRDCLSAAERQLVDEGQVDAVLGMRRALQESMHDELIREVEQTSGHLVDTLLSVASAQPDITVDIFILM